MANTTTLINVWKWNLEQAEITHKDGDRISSRRHSMNALKLESLITK